MEEEKKKKKIKILSIVIRVMLVIDLILTLTLILVKDKRREDETGFSQYNFEVVTDDDFFYLQLVVAVFDAVAGLLALLLFLAGLRGHRMHYYVSTVFLKSFEIFLAIIGLPHPDSTRLGFLIVLIFFRIAEIIVLLIFNGIIYQQMDNRVDVEKSVLDSVNKSRKVEALEQGITQTQNFHMISKVRSHYFSKV
ncbi:hypothetical protein M0811_01934 [Anaeramoeba ignava]|uniref:Uncharacterized protein n=1 Tax=Anaeramoeba ignava TaxID=1746090 RepID=A0A9Q0LDY8_ANAIG|nr:hypothetical protein M0811_01934 [Anaeramoeba ignava]